MEHLLRFVRQNWNELLVPLTITVITILAGMAVRYVLYRNLRRWTARTKSKTEDIVIAALYTPFLIWVLMLALHLGFRTSHLPTFARDLTAEILLVLFVTSMTLVFSRLVGILIRFHAGPGSFSSLPENIFDWSYF